MLAFKFLAFCLLNVVLVTSRPPDCPLKSCCVIINEINSVAISPRGQFVEIFRFCQGEFINRKIDLTKYRLLALSHDGYIISSCQLQKYISDPSWYYVIGYDSSQADLDGKLCEVDRDRITRGFLPQGRDRPFGFALVFDTNRQFKSVSLIPGKDAQGKTYYIKKKVEGRVLKKIKNSLQDFYIVGSNTGFVYCEFFKQIHEPYNRPRYTMLRDVVDEEQSISRCHYDLFHRFQPSIFKMTKPSPGLRNLCTGANPLRIEDHINFPDSIEELHVDLSAEGTRCYSVNADPGIIANEVEMEEARADDGPFFDAAVDPGQLLQEEPMEQCGDLPAPPPPHWKDCIPMSRTTLQTIVDDDFIDYKYFSKPQYCFWLQYVPEPPAVSCKLCSEMKRKNVFFDRPGSKFHDRFYKPAGSKLSNDTSDKYKNNGKVSSHFNSPFHKISEEMKELLESGVPQNELVQTALRGNSFLATYVKPTSEMMRAVFQANRMGLSFNSWPLLVDLLKHNGANLGHLYHNAVGMKTITMHISNIMHEQFLIHINNDEPFISVITDSSTDVEGIQHLIVLFQTYHVKYGSKLYYYMTIPLKTGEEGAEIWAMLQSEFKLDEIEEALKENFVSLVTDGAANMVFTMTAAARTYFNRTFYSQWCNNHRLELVIKRAIKKEKNKETGPVIDEVETFVNKIATFFSKQAATRRRILNVYKKKKKVKFQLHHIFDIRWSRSKYIALKRILDNWWVIVSALEEIAATPKTPKTTKRLAHEYMLYLQNPTFIMYMSVLCDIHYLFSIYSTRLQRESGTIIGDSYHRRNLIQSIVNLKFDNGPTTNITIMNSDVQGDIREFEENATELYGIQLGRDIFPNNSHLDEGVRLHEKLDGIVSAITKAFDYYFTDRDDFDVLYPPIMAEKLNETNFGVPEIQFINANKEWGLDEDELENGWEDIKPQLLEYIKDLEQDNRDVLEDPREFWHRVLNKEGFLWNGEFKLFIQKTLALQVSSASAERMFSVYNAIKTSVRNSLYPETTNAILRMRINGPKDLKKFDTFVFTKTFTEEHSRVDDKTRAGRKYDNAFEDIGISIYDPMFEATWNMFTNQWLLVIPIMCFVQLLRVKRRVTQRQHEVLHV